MTKKITISVVFAFALTLLVSVVAFAAQDPPPIMYQRVYGEVVAVQENSFAVQSMKESGEITVYVDQQTKFYASKNEGDVDFNDVQLGEKVVVGWQVNDFGQMMARRVLLLTDGFLPGQRFNLRVRGHVVAIDLDANTFSLQARNGERLTITVIDRTRFIGHITDLNDFQMGQSVVVVGRAIEDAPAQAAVIYTPASSNPKRYAGTIDQVILTARTFVLSTRQGSELTFAVNENTQFTSPNNEILDLSDMKAGMVAIVIAIPKDDGTSNNVATRIMVGEKTDFPNFAIKVGGKISALDEDSLTIHTRRDVILVIQITDKTKFRGRSDIKTLDDLEIGMNIFIAGQELETGKLFAQWVIVGKRANP